MQLYLQASKNPVPTSEYLVSAFEKENRFPYIVWNTNIIDVHLIS